MISYEVSIGFILICVVLWAGTFNLNDIVEAQKGHVLGFLNGFGFNPLLFPMWVMFLISAHGRNRARAVRPDRGGERARRRLPDRI
jgi:NADH:ubiquinone oxidoreductase subunit H